MRLPWKHRARRRVGAIMGARVYHLLDDGFAADADLAVALCHFRGQQLVLTFPEGELDLPLCGNCARIAAARGRHA